MKNFFAVVKSSLNNVFADANFTDETTESEVADFLETQEGTMQAQVDAVAESVVTSQEAITAAASDSAEAVEAATNLTEAVELLVQNQAATEAKLGDIGRQLSKITLGLNNIPSKTTGDDAVVKAGKDDEDATVFTIGARSQQIVERVKSGVR